MYSTCHHLQITCQPASHCRVMAAAIRPIDSILEWTHTRILSSASNILLIQCKTTWQQQQNIYLTGVEITTDHTSNSSWYISYQNLVEYQSLAILLFTKWYTPVSQQRQRMLHCTSVVLIYSQYHNITFRVRHNWSEMYTGHARLCVSVHHRMLTPLHGPGCNSGSSRGCPLVVHHWEDLQSAHRFRCYSAIQGQLCLRPAL